MNKLMLIIISIAIVKTSFASIFNKTTYPKCTLLPIQDNSSSINREELSIRLGEEIKKEKICNFISDKKLLKLLNKYSKKIESLIENKAIKQKLLKITKAEIFIYLEINNINDNYLLRLKSYNLVSGIIKTFPDIKTNYSNQVIINSKKLLEYFKFYIQKRNFNQFYLNKKRFSISLRGITGYSRSFYSESRKKNIDGTTAGFKLKAVHRTSKNISYSISTARIYTNTFDSDAIGTFGISNKAFTYSYTGKVYYKIRPYNIISHCVDIYTGVQYFNIRRRPDKKFSNENHRFFGPIIGAKLNYDISDKVRITPYIQKFIFPSYSHKDNSYHANTSSNKIGTNFLITTSTLRSYIASFSYSNSSYEASKKLSNSVYSLELGGKISF